METAEKTRAKEARTAFPILAVGSQDNSVSFWRPGSSRPILVARDLFKSSVMDLTWSANGLVCVAASYEGTIAVFLFDERELGTVVDSSIRV